MTKFPEVTYVTHDNGSISVMCDSVKVAVIASQDVTDCIEVAWGDDYNNALDFASWKTMAEAKAYIYGRLWQQHVTEEQVS